MTTGSDLTFKPGSFEAGPLRLLALELQTFFGEHPLLNFDGQHYSLLLTTNATHLVPHGLGFLPTDVIQTSVVGGTVVWNYASFTTTNLSLTISGVATGGCTVRAFIGAYKG